MNNKNPIEHLLIAGRGFTPLLTALFLQKKWGSLAPRMTLLQCGENPDPPVISCVSSIKQFHKELGIAEKDFVRKTEASFHLGTLYQFSDDHPEFFMCEAPYGVNLQAIRFNHWYTRYLNAGQRAQLDDFCMNAQLTRRGHFAPTSPKPESVYSQICYGYKLLSERYSNYLLAQLEPGVDIVNDEVRGVQTDLNGIHTVHLSNGKSIAADLYIDCSRERLLNSALTGTCSEPSKEDWRIEVTPECGLGPPHNLLTLGNDKLIFTTQLHGKTYHQEVTCNPDQPPKWLLNAQPWQKNCLTIGPATSDRPALLIDPIHLLASSLYRLYTSWPTTNHFETPAAIYSESFNNEWNCIADSDSFHAWAACERHEKCLTDSAKHRMRIFSNDGRIPPYENETMTEDQWAALFFAFGITPKVADPLSEGSDDHWLVAQLDKLKETLQTAAQQAPTMEAFYKSEVIR